MTRPLDLPTAAYGILHQDKVSSPVDEAVEQVRNLGFAILDGGYSASELAAISDAFDQARTHYVQRFGEDRLRQANEHCTLRALLTHGGETFLKLAFNANLLAALKALIPGKFLLNQQNGVINPPQETYNQGAWHRDLPYQHYVSSRPLAVNALFCIDEFTLDNGGTFVLPASHKSEPFPSDPYIERNAVQVAAKAGSFILLDCMLFHSGGFNRTAAARRAVNHVFTIPYFKQQINLPQNMDASLLTAEQRELLGFTFTEPPTIESYLARRLDAGRTTGY
jgi:ectoine hydroxylase-related dioxygenase (phytanoyl-CoA dioxygenase family)